MKNIKTFDIRFFKPEEFVKKQEGELLCLRSVGADRRQLVEHRIKNVFAVQCPVKVADNIVVGGIKIRYVCNAVQNRNVRFGFSVPCCGNGCEKARVIDRLDLNRDFKPSDFRAFTQSVFFASYISKYVLIA